MSEECNLSDEDDMMNDVEEEVKKDRNERLVVKNVIQQENGASRFINANQVRNVQTKLPVCQSAISMIKNVIGASFEIMNILKPNAFEVFIKVASLIDHYINTVFHQFVCQDLSNKLF
jgi:hypothetical protein